MLRVFRKINGHAHLPLIVNVNGSRTVDCFDIDAIAAATDAMLLHSSYSDVTVATIAAPSTQTIPTWSTMQLYIRYAYALHRYESLRDMIVKIQRTRGVEIFPLLIPVGCAWQAGMSQLLWILMHTLCALSCARGNVYLQRLLVLLKNLSFFIWCGECSQHWRASGGNEYFETFVRLNGQARDFLPIDIVLARCHNTVATNNRLNKRLSAWTVAQIVIDYREFVERVVLRRRPTICNRFECVGHKTKLSFADDDYTLPLYAHDGAAMLLSDMHLRRLARGEWLLLKLWKDLDFNVPIGAL